MKKEKIKKPFITVKEAIIASAVIILTAIAFQKPAVFFNTSFYAPTRELLPQEAEMFVEQIIDISSSQIIAATKPADEKPTLIVLYASWCGYCKMLLPNIFNLKNEGKIDDTHIIFLSVDKNKLNLAKYLLAHDYNNIFTPYILKHDEEKKFKTIIANYGGNYSKTIPYSLFFDGKGKLIKEVSGSMNKEQILNHLNEASKQPASK
jgi:thiol-disulfide isomerase/thioredoxin